MRRPNPNDDNLHGSIAVLDTNVLIDVLSCHDVLNAYFAKTSFDAAMHYRRARVRDAFILLELLHRRKARTFSLTEEPWDVLVRVVPPAVNDYKRFHVRLAVQFLIRNIWRDWTNIVGDADDRAEERGNAADRLLVDVARDYSIPLITNEGYRPDGTANPKKEMHRFAMQDDVRLLTPQQFWTGRIDPREGCDRILRSFAKRMDAFSRSQPDPDECRHVLKQMFGYVLFVLRSAGNPDPDAA